MIFNNLNELIKYLKHCPICNGSRTIDISPDDSFVGRGYSLYAPYLYDNYLVLVSRKSTRQTLPIIKINLKTNSIYLLEVDGCLPIKSFLNKWSNAILSIDCDCKECDKSFSNSNDMYLDFQSMTIKDLDIAREGYDIYFEGQTYQVTINYFSDYMLVSKYNKVGNVDVLSMEEVQLPIINIDFSDVSKVVSRIKTLLTFN